MGKKKSKFEAFLGDPEVRQGAHHIVRAALRSLPKKDQEAVSEFVYGFQHVAEQHLQDMSAFASWFKSVTRAPKTNGGPKKG